MGRDTDVRKKKPSPDILTLNPFILFNGFLCRQIRYIFDYSLDDYNATPFEISRRIFVAFFNILV